MFLRAVLWYRVTPDPASDTHRAGRRRGGGGWNPSLHDEPRLGGHAGRGPLGQGWGVLPHVGRGGAGVGGAVARAGGDGGVGGDGVRERRGLGGRGRGVGRRRGGPPGLGHGGAVGVREEGGGRSGGFWDAGGLGWEGLRDLLSRHHHLLQLVDLHPSQVGQFPLALVPIDEGVQGHVPLQEAVGHVLFRERRGVRSLKIKAHTLYHRLNPFSPKRNYRTILTVPYGTLNPIPFQPIKITAVLLF